MGYILSIDQGTTSSRAVVFDANFTPLASAQEEFPQHFPHPAWVEHDPRDLWQSVLRSCRKALSQAGVAAKDLAGIGITNQRETTLLWERKSGQPLHNAIVWQDRRTADFCETLRTGGHEAEVTAKTGLLIDPYFSASKLKWLLDTIPEARTRAANGELAFGTVDSWLIWNLTGGRAHVTDATNASRTMLYNIHSGEWDGALCRLFDIPEAVLPEVLDSAAPFGMTEASHLGAALPILGVAGDQQAAGLGQACCSSGMMKSTYGTGCFALLNTGTQAITSQNRLITTIAYQLDGTAHYALEGSIFIAGAVVQWLRDGLKLLKDAAESGPLAEKADPEQGVVLVPAFTGLGAPYWRPDCRGAIFGLTRNSGPPEMTRAALESVGYQTRDLIEAMRADFPDLAQTRLRIDGGMARSDWTMQFLADILGAEVDRPKVTETTALGAAFLAARQASLADEASFSRAWALDRSFTPRMVEEERQSRYARWTRAVEATMGF